MKQTSLWLLVAVVLSVVFVPDAWAGATCKIIPAMCPPPPGGSGGPNGVPEPGTLALLAAGAGALVAGLRGRRKR